MRLQAFQMAPTTSLVLQLSGNTFGVWIFIGGKYGEPSFAGQDRFSRPEEPHSNTVRSHPHP
jgi:hypothetical protein